MSAPFLTQGMLRSLLEYDPTTGVFTWKPRSGAAAWNTRYAGKVAGFDWRVGNVVYRSIRIFDWPFLGHRLAVLYVTGEWPTHGVDHINLNGLDNRWVNLRPATKQQNGWNTPKPRTNTTGFKGVSRDRRGKFRATIRVGGRQVWLGFHDTAEEAHAAYCEAAREQFGEYARVA